MDEDGIDMARTAKFPELGKVWTIVTQADDICYSFKFREDVKGQDILDEVCSRLGIVEKDYFGLQYTNSRGETHWLNMRNRLTRQLNKPEPYALFFCVKFYVQPHQLLQESSRRQFFLNVRHAIVSGKYQGNSSVTIQALLAQALAGDFRENHIFYNPSRTCSWTPEFRSHVILEHCKYTGMSPAVAEYCCLKEISSLEDYGMEYHNVKSDDNHNISIGIGVDCLRIEHVHDGSVRRVPYTCLRMGTHSGKTVKLGICTNELGDVENVTYRLGSKELACAFYRAITEHHAFYRCDSVRPVIKEQVARDFFDTVLSWFNDRSGEQNYIFDTERTCREAYDHARRVLYNFGASAACAMSKQEEHQEILLGDSESADTSVAVDILNKRVLKLTSQIEAWKESLHCTVCRDNVVDVVTNCGHVICHKCGEQCTSCPLCRASIENLTKFYLPVDAVPCKDTSCKQTPFTGMGQSTRPLEPLSHGGFVDNGVTSEDGVEVHMVLL